ncbi:MAG: peptidoglycan DD-metalloendopeptidase family protein [Prevotellaceae bacterium]|nr:peptidoglycan DD-metalloendopeptidase family protein [Prevotellaceae bacterium]
MKRNILLYLVCTVMVSVAAYGQRTSSQHKVQEPLTAKKQKSQAVKLKANKTERVLKRDTKNNVASYSNASIKKLQSQRNAIQKKIKQQELALKANKEDVAKRLKDLLLINGEIDENQQHIEGIQKDIHHIEGNIDILKTQLSTLTEQLKDRQAKYIRSMRYMASNRTMQDKLMFIFSAKNFYQMYRRLRFVKEYAQYQKAQGEAVKAKQIQIDAKHHQLQQVRGQKNNLLYKGQQERTKLEANKGQQQNIVAGLQQQQKTIQAVIDDQRKKDAALNAQIDRMVEIEIAKARARAAAESKRKAELAAAEKKRREAEIARKKAAAEAAARENARRIEEARQREMAAKEAARKAAAAEQVARQAQREQAAKDAATAKAVAEQRAKEAEVARQAAERKEKVDAERAKVEITKVEEQQENMQKFSTVDRMMNNGFESNRGRLPMPITGSYKIVSHFGQYNVEGLKGVTLDNKGINIMGQNGCQARAVYDGEVSAVLSYGGSTVVMLRHGAYISVYANLKSASVSRGQKVSTRQILGVVGIDNILQFQLRKERTKLNPEAWLGR